MGEASLDSRASILASSKNTWRVIPISTLLLATSVFYVAAVKTSVPVVFWADTTVCPASLANISAINFFPGGLFTAPMRWSRMR